MARILNLFGRSVSLETDVDPDFGGRQRGTRRPSVDYDVLGIGGADTEGVEALAEAQRSIEVSLSSVTSGLAEVQTLSTHMSALQANFAALFEDYRRSTLASMKLEQDRDYFNDQYREKSHELENIRGETSSLRRELDASRGNLARAQDDLEGFEKRSHLLEISRKEIEQQLISILADLRVAREDAEAHKLELVSLRQQAEVDTAKLGELSGKHHEAYEKSLLLAERCENYETTLRITNEQIAALRATIETLSHERNSLQHYAQAKDAETTQLRADHSRAFDKFQADIKARDKDVADTGPRSRASGRAPRSMSRSIWSSSSTMRPRPRTSVNSMR